MGSRGCVERGVLIRRHLPIRLVVGDVEGVLHGRDVRRLRELLLEPLPVGLGEEGAALDLGHAEAHAAEALGGLGDEQRLQGLGLGLGLGLGSGLG